MSVTNNQIKLIHVAKNKLKLDDEIYRTALVQIAGVTSSKELDGEGYQAMMGFFEHLGFKPSTPRGPSFGNRPGMASFAQLELIRTLWAEYTEGGDDASLCKWLEHSFKVSSLRFLQKTSAPKVITALKAMKARAA